ncbi:MAG: sialate O-acetylesterase, partial [Bacteroidaceae bacterium]|nr:sialate O-acetylesterase [Bacteroidaceae bacterium]
SKIRVSCLGNSITYGTGLENPETDSYPVILQQMLGEGYEVIRYGKPGATLLNRAYRPYMQSEEFHQAMQRPCDIAVIHLGVNDTDPRAWPQFREDFVRDYLSLIDSVRSMNKDCRVIVAKLTPLRNTHHRFQSGTRDWNEQIREAIATVAEAGHCEVIDFFAPLHRHIELLHDKIHPNIEGSRIMAQVAYSAITGDYGGLQLPECYTDGMVLPRNKELPIAGTSNAGDEVTVSIAGQLHTALTGLDGQWRVTLDPLPTGGPYVLSVKTQQQSIEFKDILAGEVWLCSGQSNMAFTLGECATGEEDIPNATNDRIRLLNYTCIAPTYNHVFTEEVLDKINRLQYMNPAKWEACTPESAKAFSAVGYYFAQALQDSLQVPVGVIVNAVGGSGIEAWIDRNTMEKELPNLLTDWTNNDFVMDWVRERAKVNMGEHPSVYQRHPYEPCYLFEANVEMLSHLPISGVLWYQGESNAHNVESHEKMFNMLVRSWREAWQMPDMPFYFVQLSSLNRPSWPWFRDSQRRLMNTLPHLGMAVSTDLGEQEDVHYHQKKPLGERLARWALHNDYGRRHLIPSGPLFRQAYANGNEVVVSFDYAEGMTTSDGQPIRGFEVATYDGLFYPATAEIVGSVIRLSCPEVQQPHYVRYAFQPFTDANLVNGERLPASTFRSGRLE